MDKVFERIFLGRTEEAIPLNKLISPHQFGVRDNHSTAEQRHRIINQTRDSLEAKNMGA
jgi:hypothetical protein